MLSRDFERVNEFIGGISGIFQDPFLSSLYRSYFRRRKNRKNAGHHADTT